MIIKFPDVTVTNEGTFSLLRPRTVLAREWIKDNVEEDASYFEGSLVVEHRYVKDLVEGMRAAGLEIRS